MMYESASGERFTIYTAKSDAEATQMRYAAEGKESTLFWADDGVGYAWCHRRRPGAADPDRPGRLRPDGEKGRLNNVRSFVPILTSKIWNQNISASH